MTQLKKIFFAMVLTATLGLLAASSALAQSSWNLITTSRNVRQEGTTEAVGTIFLTFTNNSGATALIDQGTTITVDFGTPIPVDPNNPLTIFAVDPSKITISGIVRTTGGAACTVASNTSTTAGSPASGANCITTSVSGSVLTLTFTNAASGDTAQVANATTAQITIAGVRVNANAHGVGAINAVVAGNSPGAHVFAISAGVPQQVAQVLAAPALTTKFESLTTAGEGGSVPLSLLLCNAAGTATVRADSTENYASALTGKTDETNLGVWSAAVSGLPSTPKVRYAISGIPAGVQVSAAISTYAATPGTTLEANPVPGANGLTLPATGTFHAQTSPTLTTLSITDQNTSTGVYTFLSTADGSSTNVDINLGGTTSLSAIETLGVIFQFSVPSASALSGSATSAAPVKITVSLTGASSLPGEPQFVSGGINNQGSANVFRSGACASYLILPWVASYANGSFETAFVVNNASVDAIGTTGIGTVGGTAGDCTLLLFGADGKTQITLDKTAIPALGAIPAGGSGIVPGIQSGLKKDFTGGYGELVCNFQLAHAYVYQNNPTTGAFYGNYEALSVTNPRLGPGATVEQAGQ